jgi:hypothetical protein
MSNPRNTWILRACVWFFGLCLLASCRGDGSDSELGESIYARLRKNPAAPFCMSELAPFEWSKLYVFNPYTSSAQMERELGFRWSDAARVDLVDDEGAVVLAFVRDEQVVRHVKLRRRKGDFAVPGPGQPGPFLRAKAVFKGDLQGEWMNVKALESSESGGLTCR